MEAAAARRVGHVRVGAFQSDARRALAQVHGGHSRHQRLCIWVMGRLEDGVRRTHLDQLAQVHNADMVGHVAHDSPGRGR
jgi:hypothetical protein